MLAALLQLGKGLTVERLSRPPEPCLQLPQSAAAGLPALAGWHPLVQFYLSVIIYVRPSCISCSLRASDLKLR